MNNRSRGLFAVVIIILIIIAIALHIRERQSSSPLTSDDTMASSTGLASSVPLTGIDCGTSTPVENQLATPEHPTLLSDPDKDSAMVCLGRNMLTCTDAYATVKYVNNLYKFQVKKSGASCITELYSETGRYPGVVECTMDNLTAELESRNQGALTPPMIVAHPGSYSGSLFVIAGSNYTPEKNVNNGQCRVY